jgi:hypothetical protein
MPQPTTPDQRPEPGRQPAMLDLPLILEQLQDQIDQLHSIVETQQTVIEQHTARLAILEQPDGHDR